MGAEPSKEIQKTCGQGNRCGPINDFPNIPIKDREIPSWSLLHQCTLDNWKQGHAEAANFQDSVFSCDRTLHKDCSTSFCMSRQGVINVDRPTSVFSFRRRKFAKMAEHFEYNYIPAQMSSVNHFRVKSILCFKNSLVVLHLSRNGNSQFGLLDLESNKFLGVFGKQPIEYANENFSGELSPDRSKCLVLKPKLFRSPNQNGLDNLTSYSQIMQSCSGSIHHNPLIFSDSGLTSHAPLNLLPSMFDEDEGSSTETVPLVELLLYDMSSKHLLSRVPLKDDFCHFSFDPRYSWRRISLTNFVQVDGGNSLSLVELMAPSTPKKNIVSLPASGIMSNEDTVSSRPKNRYDITDWTWSITSVNHRLGDPWEEAIIGASQIRSSSPSSSSSSSSDFPTLPKPVDLRHSRDGRLIVVTMLELGECRCREKKSIRVQDRGASRGLLNLNQPEHFRCRRYRYHPNLPVMNCTLYIFDADNAKTLQCIQYHRYICQLHTCPTNYVPVFSICGTKMAVTVDAMLSVSGDSTPFGRDRDSYNLTEQSNRRRCDSILLHHVQVYRLPLPAFCLQALCRAVLLENGLPISKLTLPPKILHYLKFGPEFD